jgi:hypothetical protein
VRKGRAPASSLTSTVPAQPAAASLHSPDLDDVFLSLTGKKGWCAAITLVGFWGAMRLYDRDPVPS